MALYTSKEEEAAMEVSIPGKLSVVDFQDICVDVQTKRILWNVSGSVDKGEILAIMGPSGGGKTTLLNALAGYTPISQGSVLVRGRKINKRIRRRISYVLQGDIFFPDLTLRETLIYSALLRLPSSLGFKKKIQKVNDLIEVLGLGGCQNTIIGSPVKRGLSGGEKKRANIACEMLTDPFILLLDEPTSGLDSSSAYSLFTNLKKLAHSEGKTIVTSIHQPSSQLFYSFDKLLLMAKGKVAYYGPAKSVMEHFSSLGLHCTLLYNPADYILEMVSDPESRHLLIGPDPPETHLPQEAKWWQKVWPVSTFYQLYHRRKQASKPLPPSSIANQVVVSVEGEKSSGKGCGVVHSINPMLDDNCRIENGSVELVVDYESEPRQQFRAVPPLQSIAENNVLFEITDQSLSHLSLQLEDSDNIPKLTKLDALEKGEDIGNVGKKRVSFDEQSPSFRKASKGTVVSSSFSSAGGRRGTTVTAFVEDNHLTAAEEKKWATPWHWQFMVLFHRNCKQTWKQMFSKLVILQSLCVLVCSCLVWFQIPKDETSVPDVTGLLFFSLTYWAFSAVLHAVGTFPNEQVIITKERAAGSYRLSAYVAAKMLSEDPVQLVFPAVSMCVVLPVAGVLRPAAFFGILLVVLVHTAFCQALAYCIGAVFLNMANALTTVVIVMLSSLLLAGYFAPNLPFWMAPLKYLSSIGYGFESMLQLYFTPDVLYRCDPVKSSYPRCQNLTSPSAAADNSTYVTGSDILRSYDLPVHWGANLAILFAAMLMFRLLAYLALKFIHRKETPQ